jgi:Uri superfamily endonuclease
MPKLGRVLFQRGFYAYTGSALGNGATNLRHRIARHIKKEKTKRWHIDFLLSNKEVNVAQVIVAGSHVNRECQINGLIRSIDGAAIPINGFGSSDCKQNCGSHLIYLGNKCSFQEIAGVYNRFFGYEPSRISPSSKPQYQG